MNIQQIYDKYHIMKNLQEHQYRVAAVGKYICDRYKQTINAKLVITTCLIHDMGNILKFDLLRFPEFLEPEGLEYWQNVKEEFRKKYGDSEHLATERIAEELGMSNDVIEILNNMGSSKSEDTYINGSIERKVCAYVDMRVAPFGVDSFRNRMEDLRIRYANKNPTPPYEERYIFLSKIEDLIFADCNCKPEEITEKAVAGYIEGLRGFEV